jgi:hypothetical protein
MTARLPVLDRRAPRAAAPAATPRVSVPRTLLCVAGDQAERGGSQAFAFALGLVRALSARGVAVAGLLVAEESSAEQHAALRDAGAAPVLALGLETLQGSVAAEFEQLPAACVVIGIGPALLSQLRPAFAVRIAPVHGLDGSADLELPRDNPLVANALAETLAQRSGSAAPRST